MYGSQQPIFGNPYPQRYPQQQTPSWYPQAQPVPQPASLIQVTGLVTPDGAADLDAIRDAAKGNIPATGLAVELPMGICLRATAEDVDRVYEYIVSILRLYYEYIRKETSV